MHREPQVESGLLNRPKAIRLGNRVFHLDELMEDCYNSPRVERIVTFDQVIARNVQRLREARQLSVTRLAEKMKVNRKTIYDYEHRSGRPHAFKWSEMFRLCAVLECSVFELVLPGEDEKVSVRVPFSGRVEWDLSGLDPQSRQLLDNLDPASVEVEDMPEIGPIGREEIARIAFHLTADVLPGRLDQLAERLSEQVRKLAARDRGLAADRLVEAIRALGMEGEID